MGEKNFVAPVMGDWGSIELAPDNQVFIAIDRLGGAVIANRYQGRFFEDNTGEELFELVGWMPIPPPKKGY